MTSWQTKEAPRVYDKRMRHDHHAYIRRLAAYIKDDSTVAAHAKREFGVAYSKAEVAKIRRSMVQPYVRHVEPLATTESTKWAQDADLGSRRLRDKVLRAARG